MRTQCQLLIALGLLASSCGASEPAVKLTYDETADEQCAASQHSPIKPEWKNELEAQLPMMRALWEAVEPNMAQAVTAITNKPFAPEGQIHLTLCNIPSNALNGITVNMRYALWSFAETPVPLRYKVDIAFHELLHDFLSRNVPAGSPLLVSHASEPSCVRNHLHLLSLQKAVLLRIDDPNSLAQVISIDSQLPTGCYKRAWSLVNSTQDAYRQYVAELAQ